MTKDEAIEGARRFLDYHSEGDKLWIDGCDAIVIEALAKLILDSYECGIVDKGLTQAVYFGTIGI